MHQLNKVLQKVARGIYKVFFVFATVAFAVLLTLLLYNVISRNYLGGAVAWIEEGTKFLFCWMMFLGISIGVYSKKHLGVDFLVSKYPKRVKRIFEIISDILSIVLYVALVIYGFKYSAKTMGMMSPIMEIPYGLVYLCVPLCGVFCTFYTIVDMVDEFCKGKEEDK